MVDKTERPSDEFQTLRVQLQELNTRSRMYGAQIWHVPFAYLALTGFALSRFIDEPRFELALFSCGFFGILIFIHVVGMTNGNQRSVDAIANIEKQLGLDVVTLWKPSIYIYPFWVICAASSSFYIIIGFCVLVR